LYERDGELYVKAWTTRAQTGKLVSFGNDGAGSGLDADLLDGKNSSIFLVQQSDLTTANWNTFIDGTESSWRTVLNHNGSNRPTASYTYGTVLNFSKSGQAKFQLYASEQASSGRGIFYRTGWNTNYRAWVEMWDSGNDGSGSGLDADLLDGQQGSHYLNYNNLTNKPAAGMTTGKGIVLSMIFG
jgi:hypothetical protein